MKIVRLPDSLINQIAAGEVVERPASVVKELVENALDAGAHHISVSTSGGGKSIIRVADNGWGMDRPDLRQAVERHCTSKLASDLLDIRTLGFRGEALPSIGSVAKLTITSRTAESEHGWKISVDNGSVGEAEPAALSGGTIIEVRDLFARIPARLKFLKSERAETAAVTDVVKRMALAFPAVHFSVSGSDRSPVEYPATTAGERIAAVLGREFLDNAIPIDAEREGILLQGFIGLPTFNRGNALNQYFFVNGRPVRDRQLAGAIRGAYADVLARNRHAQVMLALTMPPHEVDVNVHPAKADVRFRDAALVRGLVVGALRQALAAAGSQSATTSAQAMRASFTSGPAAVDPARPGSGSTMQSQTWNPDARVSAWAGEGGKPAAGFSEPAARFEGFSAPSARHETMDEASPVHGSNAHPLGAARAQLHKNYIVAQTENGLVIVDQHAAHERIVYEALKKGMKERLSSQLLLVPEIIDLPEEDAARLEEASDALAAFGLVLERFGPGAVAVRETPALLGEVNIQGLVRDLADELAEWGGSETLEARLNHVAATMACHGSVRSGRILRTEEMNALLRQMEITPNSGQCNHGRPTYIELELKDIERLFGR